MMPPGSSICQAWERERARGESTGRERLLGARWRPARKVNMLHVQYSPICREGGEGDALRSSTCQAWGESGVRRRTTNWEEAYLVMQSLLVQHQAK